MRELEEELQQNEDRRVRLAIEIFCYRERKYMGAYLACMGGADAVIFTGGIGENSREIRARICAGLELVELAIDEERNRQTAGVNCLTISWSTPKPMYAHPTESICRKVTEHSPSALFWGDASTEF